MSRVCKVCRQRFHADPPAAIVCSELCSLTYAVSAGGKARKRAAVKAAAFDRKGDHEKSQAMKSHGQLIAAAQTAFNAFVRERDRQAGHACISSGLALDWSGNNVDAGHYRSRGSAPHLRFCEANCHAQSKKENRYGSGNIVAFRAGMLERIGLAALEALEADQAPRRYTRDELVAIKKNYAAKARELQKARA